MGYKLLETEHTVGMLIDLGKTNTAKPVNKDSTSDSTAVCSGHVWTRPIKPTLRVEVMSVTLLGKRLSHDISESTTCLNFQKL